ncbi:NAD-dependent dehydratase [Chryseobacterium lactis]|uniref:NAD-dependent dehydratase n=1 Tax=Chryseobacterium lactis TaxID=1241981 RepID=A0A3G6RV82_CHRLC|nr:NAD(P)H-binding protein [Chryseobacterium lactis]AZA80792.1 NAD-dependent epimerase/dehydratase family protein [Chryseobacterium lactis]AZB05794.1 NAD-dependent epimerase/dehydratase family protein [Chryseobacterium lactis]PNW13487.1 NAD-dependent dehydratase [Chryseobacterium lactis]
MKIVITGSLGNVAKPLTQQLAAEGHQLTVISSNEDRRQDIESLGATPAIGSITDVDFLTKTFEGADAVFVMTPPAVTETNIIEGIVDAGKNYAEALKKAQVKRAVMLSSVGAESPIENGQIKGLHQIENIYNKVENTSFTFLRAGYFYNNLLNDIPLIQNTGIIGSNYSENTIIPLVHPSDIAKAAAEELVKDESGKNVRYIVGDIRKASDFAKVLGSSVNKPELPWVEFSDEQTLNGMLQAGLPQDMADQYTEMGRGIRTGIIQKDFIEHGSPVTGSIKLEDFAKEFSSKF